MKFDDVWAKVGHLPYTNKERSQRLYDLVFDNKMHDTMELGVAYGKTLAVTLAALHEIKAQDPYVEGAEADGYDLVEAKEWFTPSAEETIKSLRLPDNPYCGHAHARVFRDRVSYQWSLLCSVRVACLFPSGRTPYDLVFLDGAHNCFHDVGAFFMAERLLNPGGYLIVDDLPWVPSKGMTAPMIWGTNINEAWSEEQRNTPHMQWIWDCLVKTHPNLTDFDESDPWWGVCRKKEA